MKTVLTEGDEESAERIHTWKGRRELYHRIFGDTQLCNLYNIFELR